MGKLIWLSSGNKCIRAVIRCSDALFEWRSVHGELNVSTEFSPTQMPSWHCQQACFNIWNSESEFRYIRMIHHLNKSKFASTCAHLEQLSRLEKFNLKSFEQQCLVNTNLTEIILDDRTELTCASGSRSSLNSPAQSLRDPKLYGK